MLQISKDKIEYVVGNEDILQSMPQLHATHIFEETVVAFLSALSKAISMRAEARQYEDLVAFAFWCRKTNVIAIKKEYGGEDERIGRGIIFHIAPSNVALSFAYSMVTGLLSGNANIIRIPSRRFLQADLFCNIVKDLLQDEEFSAIQDRICLIRYGHEKDITDALSQICNTRIIYGGDATISTIRQSPLPPRSNEITFSNRFSICLIDADRYLADYDKVKTAHGFYNDTYLSDQNACTSPRILFWVGKNREEAKEVFWNALANQTKNYELQPVQTVSKLDTYCRYSAYSKSTFSVVGDYRIVRVCIEAIDEKLFECFEGSGYFYEFDAERLDDILPVCKLECQTLSHIGFDADELKAFIFKNAPRGVDRIVPVGQTMEFSLIWDGVDIIRTLTRIISTR
jgi:hypothetical protein